MTTILSLSLSGSIFIVILLLCKPLYKERLSKRWQYYVWLLVIMRLLLPLSPEVNLMGTLFYGVRQAGTSAVAEAEPVNMVIDRAAITPTQARAIPERQTPAPFLQTIETRLPEVVLPETTLREVAIPAQQTIATQTHNDISGAIPANIWLLWLSVAALLFVRKIVIYRGFVRRVKAGTAPGIDGLERLGKIVEQAGIKAPVRMYINGRVSSPLLVGFFRPIIVLPSLNISTSDFKYTILHELTHYKRGDMFYKWLVQLTVCLHWFNPLVYIMGREIGKACELSCDESVIANLDYCGMRAYGDTLLNALRTGGNHKSSLSSVALTGSKNIIKERLDLIMNFKKKSRLTIIAALFITMLIGAGAAFAGVYTTSRPQDEITVPNFEGLSAELAKMQAELAGLQTEFRTVSGLNADADTDDRYLAIDMELIARKAELLSLLAELEAELALLEESLFIISFAPDPDDPRYVVRFEMLEEHLTDWIAWTQTEIALIAEELRAMNRNITIEFYGPVFIPNEEAAARNAEMRVMAGLTARVIEELEAEMVLLNAEFQEAARLAAVVEAEFQTIARIAENVEADFQAAFRDRYGVEFEATEVAMSGVTEWLEGREAMLTVMAAEVEVRETRLTAEIAELTAEIAALADIMEDITEFIEGLDEAEYRFARISDFNEFGLTVDNESRNIYLHGELVTYFRDGTLMVTNFPTGGSSEHNIVALRDEHGNPVGLKEIDEDIIFAEHAALGSRWRTPILAQVRDEYGNVILEYVEILLALPQPSPFTHWERHHWEREREIPVITPGQTFEIPSIAPQEVVLLGQIELRPDILPTVSVSAESGMGLFVGIADSPYVESVSRTLWTPFITNSFASSFYAEFPSDTARVAYLYVGNSAGADYLTGVEVNVSVDVEW